MINGQKFPIMEMLKVGQENAISRTDLANYFGCSTREISSQVAYERNNGAIIISSSGTGYWLPKDEEDLKLFIRVQNARINSMRSTLSGAKSLLIEITKNQIEGGEE